MRPRRRPLAGGSVPALVPAILLLTVSGLLALPVGTAAGTAGRPSDGSTNPLLPSPSSRPSAARVADVAAVVAPVPSGPAVAAPRPAALSLVGSVLSTLSVGSNPLGVVANPTNGLVYVADYDSDQLTILNGTDIVSTIGVPTNPTGGVYDPSTGDIDVSSYGADVVTFVSGTQTLSQVTVGTNPYPGVYDAADGDVYVPNYGSDNVTLISGTSVVGSIALSTGQGPDFAAYDSANQDVYVADYTSGTVSILSGTKLVSTIHVGVEPGDLAFDPDNSEVYVPNVGSGNYSVISGASVVANPSLGYNVWAAAYDGDNHDIYLGAYGASNVTAISGTTVEGALTVGLDPLAEAFEPTDGAMYVASSDTDTVSIVGTGLIIGPVVATPARVPSNSSDLGESFDLGAPLIANTSWHYTYAVNDSDPGVGCTSPSLTLTGPADSLGNGHLNVTCLPSAAGSYTVRLILNATGRITVATPINFVVNPKFALAAPVANQGHRRGVSATDVTVKITWNLSATGGTGTYTAYDWTGFPTGSCSGTAGPTPVCAFTKTGAFGVQVTVTDSDGSNATSPSLAFSVVGLPAVSTPLANRSTSDVGQSTGFTTTASGGSGGYTYHWSGVPSSCATTTVPSLDCAPTKNGSFSVSVSVNDTNGGSSPVSQAVDIFVFTDPVIEPPVATPAKVSEDENFAVSINVTGGPPGDDHLMWQGLPAGACSFQPPENETGTCRTDQPGTYNVYVIVVDADDYTLFSKTTAITVTGSLPNGNTGNGSTSSGTLFGLPSGDAFALIGLLLIVVVVAIVALAMRSRSGPGRDGEEPTEEFDEGAGGESAVEGEEAAEGEEEPLPEGDGEAEEGEYDEEAPAEDGYEGDENYEDGADGEPYDDGAEDAPADEGDAA